MTARKLLGAGGGEGSGRLAMRRESIWASHSGKKSVSTVSAKPGRGMVNANGVEGFTSSAAAFIANPNAFRPVHLYPPQYALHASFTPAHMPLPVHLGIQTYYKPDSRMKDGEMFAPHDENARITAIQNIVKVAGHGNASAGHRKKMTNLREHLATVANLSTHPQLATVLAATHPAQANAVDTLFDQDQQATVFDGFVLGEFHSNIFGPSSDINTAKTFDEMVQARLSGQTVEALEELPSLQQADRAWESVLAKMDSAVAVTESATSTLSNSNTPALSIADAVSEVETLLASLGLGVSAGTVSSASSFIRRTSTRRVGRIEQMAFRPMRVTMSGADVQMDQMVWMDSVKRKRQKKISKHK